MQRLGAVLHISPSRNIIAFIEPQRIPRIGETVIDEELKQVGRIIDIFGPVTKPYASIKPAIKNPEVLLNKTLYVASPQNRERRKRHFG